jgi:hypothetical protein
MYSTLSFDRLAIVSARIPLLLRHRLSPTTNHVKNKGRFGIGSNFIPMVDEFIWLQII